MSVFLTASWDAKDRVSAKWRYGQELRRKKNHKDSIWEKFKLSVLVITLKKAYYAESGELGGINCHFGRGGLLGWKVGDAPP